VLGTATSQAVFEIMEAMLSGQSAEGLEAIHHSLDAGADPRQFARQIVEYLRSLLLVAMGNAAQVDATAEVRSQMARHALVLPVDKLLRVIQIFNQAATDLRSSWQPALPLEMAFIEAISSDDTPQDQPPPQEPNTPTSTSGPAAARKPANPASGKASKAEPRATDDITPEDAITNRQLESSWNLVLSQLKNQDPSLTALVNSVKTRLLRGNMLTLGMSGEVLKLRLEDPANIELLQKVLKRVMGRDIYVQVVLTSATKSTPPAEVDHDGMVASAVRDLGGEIVDIQ
jgi:DNA polymerase-3 subunit gamma/tau